MPPDERLVVDLYKVLFSSKNWKFGSWKFTCRCPHVSTSITTSFLLNTSHISGDSSLFVDLETSPWTLSIANFSAHAPSGKPYFFAALSRFADRSASSAVSWHFTSYIASLACYLARHFRYEQSAVDCWGEPADLREWSGILLHLSRSNFSLVSVIRDIFIDVTSHTCSCGTHT